MKQTAGRRGPTAVSIAAGLLVLAVGVGLTQGAVGMPTGPVLITLLDRLPLLELSGGLQGVDAQILTQWRLPRVVLAALVGGVLAACGAAYQGVFRNPLADPYLLGAAAGAGLGATLVLVYAPALAVAGLPALPVAAFAGALFGVGSAYLVGSVADRRGSGASLLLAGVAVASFLTAVQTAVQQQHADTLQQVYSWILGALGTADWGDVGLMLPYAAVSSAVLLFAGRALDVLAVGDDEAQALGLHPQRLRLVVLAAASLGTASAVAVSGLIGFVGLVVPHIVRRLAGGSYRLVLPVSLLGGGAFLIVADVVARTAVAPGELPIGVVTAFVGAPFFAALLRLSGPAS